ncbi:TolC family protein [Colwellia sp. BRX8-9]|uniref:TolC family protein n=1 Tax=Colwellia sp. BRX8-9 TaxID=2759831 RepID=UPI0015F66C8E|nr:TolC family protein [Colwellia sp. BRX8-9]MBA6347394.1 TolC family protein [Colwellia sp. BRX8-9]
MENRFRIQIKHSVMTVLATTLLLACSSTSELDKNIRNINLPATWQQSEQNLQVENNWLEQLDSPQVQQLVRTALASNHQLKIQAYNVEIQKQQLIISGSTLWPSLDLSLRSGRNKYNDSDTYTNSSSVNLNLTYELDLWGKLSSADQQANLTFMAEQSNFEQSKQQLVVDVVTKWFAVVEAEKLLSLYQGRVKNSQQNLDIIESGYNSGLSEALDVYLTRNELNNELTRVWEQKTVKTQLIRQLERLVGEYPTGTLLVDADLPLLTSDIPLGLPSELISRKPQLKSSWYLLLAKDAGLAYAHKQRFPSLTLTASVGDSGIDIDDLLSGSSLAWSLFGNISAPLFNAGRLAANEEQARLALKQNEQQYLEHLYNAFTEVENAVTQEKSLKNSYKSMLAAQENAKVAATLSFEQYQSGLVNYTTVLDAQSRSFDAQSTLIKLKNRLIANRIQLHLALGGDFTVSEKTATTINPKAE